MLSNECAESWLHHLFHVYTYDKRTHFNANIGVRAEL